MLPGRLRQPAQIQAGVLAVGGARSQVGRQPLVSRRVLPHRYYRLADAGAGGQHRLDLAGLDPEPADLDLVISAPGEDQLPVRRPPGQVPGPVHPLPRHPERARHEPLAGQPRTVRIAAGQLRPRQVQLPGHPGRDRAQPPIQHIDPGISQRSADRRRPGPGQRPGHRGAHRVLGRPVNVDQPPPARPPGRQLAIQRLPGGHQGSDRAQRARLQPGQHRRRHRQVRGPLPGRQARQLPAAGSWPGSGSTSATPLPSITRSCTEASKLNEANCSTRTPGPVPSTGPTAAARFASPRCGTATPLGVPVDPEVKITYASPPPGTGTTGSGASCAICAATARSSSSMTRTRPAGTPPSASPVPASSPARLPASIAASLAGG